MKAQISITIDEETLIKAREELRKGLFRNKSHLFEYAVRRLIENE